MVVGRSLLRISTGEYKESAQRDFSGELQDVQPVRACGGSNVVGFGPGEVLFPVLSHCGFGRPTESRYPKLSCGTTTTGMFHIIDDVHRPLPEFHGSEHQTFASEREPDGDARRGNSMCWFRLLRDVTSYFCEAQTSTLI